MVDKATGMKEAALVLRSRIADLPADEVIAECHAFWQEWGTVPQPLAALRKAALRQVRERGTSNGQKIGWIARNLGFSPNRFSRLTRPTTGGVTA